jgi:hypothetical protein
MLILFLPAAICGGLLAAGLVEHYTKGRCRD